MDDLVLVDCVDLWAVVVKADLLSRCQLSFFALEQDVSKETGCSERSWIQMVHQWWWFTLWWIDSGQVCSKKAYECLEGHLDLIGHQWLLQPRLDPALLCFMFGRAGHDQLDLAVL